MRLFSMTTLNVGLNQRRFPQRKSTLSCHLTTTNVQPPPLMLPRRRFSMLSMWAPPQPARRRPLRSLPLHRSHAAVNNTRRCRRHSSSCTSRLVSPRRPPPYRRRLQLPSPPQLATRRRISTPRPPHQRSAASTSSRCPTIIKVSSRLRSKNCRHSRFYLHPFCILARYVT